MKKITLKIGIFLLLILLSSCQEDKVAMGDFITPSNIQIEVDIVGADTENPNGDGSGKVNFKATADNVISFQYMYNGEVSSAPGGLKTYNFALSGTNTYEITILAFGTAGLSTSKTIEVEVLATYEPPADLLEMLYANDSRTWRLKAESTGHFGVGPEDAVDPIWWAAPPFDKDGTGCYDDRWIFNSDGSYQHITNGSAYGQSIPMNQDIGDPGMETNYGNEYENYPLDDYSGTYTITAPGGIETLSLSGLGYHGYYVGGDHTYKIVSRSANEMNIVTIGADGLAWFAILVAE